MSFVTFFTPYKTIFSEIFYNEQYKLWEKIVKNQFGGENSPKI